MLLLIGSVFALVGAIGLFRLPDFFMPARANQIHHAAVSVASWWLRLCSSATRATA
ncbi:monovalent cation/H(+) antiporter subunit G [Cupriavidus basilensis]